MPENLPRGGTLKKMQQLLSNPIRIKLERLLENVGDMSLKRRAKSIIQELNPQKGDKILDLGCGTGYYLFLLSNLPVDLILVGLDNDHKALSEAKENLNKKIKFIISDSHQLPFLDKTFDKVVASEVLEHLDNDQKALGEIFRILKPGGKLVISSPSINYPFFWDPINWILQHFFGMHVKKGFFSGIWNQHIRLYELKELESKFNKANFEIETAEELTTWCLPFNHYIVNIVARLLYDVKISSRMADNLSKFRNTKKPLLIDWIFKAVNLLDKLNEVFPQKNGVNVFVVARRPN